MLIEIHCHIYTYKLISYTELKVRKHNSGLVLQAEVSDCILPTVDVYAHTHTLACRETSLRFAETATILATPLEATSKTHDSDLVAAL